MPDQSNWNFFLSGCLNISTFIIFSVKNSEKKLHEMFKLAKFLLSNFILFIPIIITAVQRLIYHFVRLKKELSNQTYFQDTNSMLINNNRFPIDFLLSLAFSIILSIVLVAFDICGHSLIIFYYLFSI